MVATELTAVASPARVNIALDEKATVSGRLIRKDTGAGLYDARIYLWRKAPSDIGFRLWQETRTDPNGNYKFDYLTIDELGYTEFRTQFYATGIFEESLSPIVKVEGYKEGITPPVKVNTSTSIKAEPSPIGIPASLTVSGYLKRTDTGAGLAGKTVGVWIKKPNQSFTFYGSLTTLSDGKYICAPRIEVEGTWQFYAEFLGDSQFNPSKSPTISLEAYSMKPTTLSLEFSVVPKYVGDSATIKGKLIGDGQGLANQTVKINVRKDYGTWQIETFPKTDSYGSFSYTDVLSEVGYFEWQAKFEPIQGIYLPSESNIIGAKVEEKPITPPPEEKYYALKVSYYNLTGASAESIKAGVKSLVVPECNLIINPLGFDYVDVDATTGYAPQWQAGYFEIVYKPRGSPAIPVALLLKTIIVVAIVIGICVFAVAWYYGKVLEYESKKSLDDLLREGYITKEQWEKLREAEEKPSIWDQIMSWLPYLLLFLIIASIAGALPRGRRED